MVDIITEKLTLLLSMPLESYPSPAAIIDQWIIVRLKKEHRELQALSEEADELERQIRILAGRVKDKVELLKLTDKLVMFHREMWKTEDEVRNSKIPLEERMRSAFEADMKNDERAKLKTDINRLFGVEQGSEAKIRGS